VKAPDTIIIEGRAYSWRAILALRREQLDAWKAAQPEQPALFEVRLDRRPAVQTTAGGRFRAPSLLDWQGEEGA